MIIIHKIACCYNLLINNYIKVYGFETRGKFVLDDLDLDTMRRSMLIVMGQGGKFQSHCRVQRQRQPIEMSFQLVVDWAYRCNRLVS